MCGITGWVDWQRDLRVEEGTLEKMARTLSRRGPDDLNVWSCKQAAFGHTRLIVVDPEGGVQPMTKTVGDRSFTIAYNGELYNTEDLRKELLQRGHKFSSHSDTEVLLTAFIEWGPDCLERLNGIFAFAIWNTKDHHLFIARDRLGVKPLFYTEKAGGLIFGSEIKALLAHPMVKAEVDAEGLAEVFGLGPSRTPGHGVFCGIHELRPGHAMHFTNNGVKITRYWNVQSKEHYDNVEETARNIHDILQNAVERQLVADVPVATFLSGGVDSSALTAFASHYFKREGRGPLHTYSIDYVDNEKYFKANEFQPNADGPWIKIVSDALGTIHHTHVIQTDQLVEALKEAVHVRDMPGMADIDSSLLWFCKQVKKDVTVGLSGECADEIFGGYPWFRREEDLTRGGFPWMRSTKEREQLLHPEWRKKLNLESYLHDRYNETLKEVPLLPGESKESAKRRELFYFNMVWFMTTLLDRKDRMSMGASFEARVPFADHRLVEYVWNIPWEMKNLDGREKGILRKALEGVLPHDVLYRKKSPYPKTHNPHYTNAVKKWLLEIIDNRNAPILQLIDEQKVRDIVNTDGEAFKVPWFGQLMSGPQLIAHLSQMNTWLEDYKIEIRG
ncbi:asparagine synthase (glutamine-hydrolyzing) [Anaerobacillus sp. MEB173]|uniref:asparagine synthase (glutamine-hydrolyzing) n=1 Tax=Anaerobacillus sp. MEB173 TaxID=3383345 RepID=UPI003F92B444